MTETELIDRLQEDDSKAFNRLYRMYASELMSFSMKYMRDVQDSEEIVEDTFVALWSNRHTIKNAGTVRPWLYTTARNRITDRFRARLSSPVYTDYVEMQEPHVNETGQSEMEYAEFERRVINLIDGLPPTQRHVIRLSKLENLSNSEISEKLGLSQQTVRNTLSMGLKKMREGLGMIRIISILTFLIIFKVLFKVCSV
ncbi:MAG: RNA polymerase sigma-70 factor [Muribaculaceae bacterium]|nr:RNA polymerase sigma-70 factor [Muribaculaceae bacterium]